MQNSRGRLDAHQRVAEADDGRKFGSWGEPVSPWNGSDTGATNERVSLLWRIGAAVMYAGIFHLSYICL